MNVTSSDPLLQIAISRRHAYKLMHDSLSPAHNAIRQPFAYKLQNSAADIVGARNDSGGHGALDRTTVAVVTENKHNWSEMTIDTM